jgi:hypothetical protein
MNKSKVSDSKSVQIVGCFSPDIKVVAFLWKYMSAIDKLEI